MRQIEKKENGRHIPNNKHINVNGMKPRPPEDKLSG